MSQKIHTNSFQRFAFQRPVIFSILVIILAGVLTEIPIDRVLTPWLESPAPTLWKVTIGHTLAGLFIVWLLAYLGMWREARFNRPDPWKSLWLLWPFAVFTLLNLEAVFSGNLVVDTSRPGLILLFVFTNLAIGFVEEVMARALVLNLLLRRWGHTRRGFYGAVLLSGLLFGISHIFNLFTGHLSPLANLTQIGYSIAFGVVFAACFIRNNSIWPVIIMHALVDFAGGLRHISLPGIRPAALPNTTIEAAITSLVVSVPLLLYGLFILRKSFPASSSASPAQGDDSGGKPSLIEEQAAS